MELNLEKVANLNPQAKRILKANTEAEMSGFLEERVKLIGKYENQIEWFKHVGIDSLELKDVCKNLHESDADNIIVIVITDTETSINTFMFVEENLENFIGIYTQID
jgi:hypothetical protein